jgi:hypothetical protein
METNSRPRLVPCVASVVKYGMRTRIVNGKSRMSPFPGPEVAHQVLENPDHWKEWNDGETFEEYQARILKDYDTFIKATDVAQRRGYMYWNIMQADAKAVPKDATDTESRRSGAGDWVMLLNTAAGP